ncbi:BTB/POZ [Penicillium occitanis (nom. inval.)]|nr:hypothetical protein PENOC_058850 [Penicillium occitanis (nom. inval.)]PCG99950.1 BTB/POZ [Penicillium occitanis (nom. inval.)]
MLTPATQPANKMIKYSKILQSPQFTFLVGEEETPMSIHAAALEGLSDPLNAMINNGMKESKSKVAIFKDVDVEVFAAFCEFAYTGKYESTLANYLNEHPEPDQETTEDESDQSSKNRQTEDSDEEEEEEVDEGNVVALYDQYSFEMRLDFWDFQKRKFGRDLRWKLVFDRLEFGFTMKVYSFATKYLIEPLRQYCLRIIHEDLRNFRVDEENSHIILDLLKSTYLHTSSQEPDGQSLMRDLVIHYVTCKFTTLAKDEAFTCLVESNGEIGSDLVIAINKRKHGRKCKCKCRQQDK